MMVEDIAVHQWCHQFQHYQWVWLLLPLLTLQRHLNPFDQWATIILQTHVDNSYVQGAGEFRPQWVRGYHQGILPRKALEGIPSSGTVGHLLRRCQMKTVQGGHHQSTPRGPR